MKVYDAANIRNVALVGHSGSGKTQLTSAALFDAGAVNRFGKVDDGTTITDFDEEEIARKHTLSASLAYAEWNKTKINFIDTPGIANFLADARAALRVADAAIVVVDAVSGVQVQTEKTWQAAEEIGLPRLVVVNRLDRERASLERTLKSIHARAQPHRRPDSAADRRGEIVPRRRRSRGAESVRVSARRQRQVHRVCRFRPTWPPTAAAAREALIEMVAEADESLMEKFFEAGTLTQEQLVAGLRARRRPGKCFRCSARRRRSTSASSRCSMPSSATCRRPPSGR